MPTDMEIDATLGKSRELADRLEELAREASVPGKNFAALGEMADKEFQRLGEVLATKGAPQGTGSQCLGAAADLIGDWADFEVAVLEGLHAVKGSSAPIAPARARAPRGGMRV